MSARSLDSSRFVSSALTVTGLSALVAAPGLRSLGAVTRDMSTSATVEALLLSGAITAHVADTAAGIASALLLSSVRSSTVTARLSAVLGAITRDVADLVALAGGKESVNVHFATLGSS